MQHCIQKRIVNFYVPIVADETQLAKLVHEMADPGSRGAYHLRQRLLTDVQCDRLWVAFLAEVRSPRRPGRASFSIASGSGGVSKVSGNFMAGIEAAWSIAATFARLALELRDETPRRR
jgi:hypothetical protein